MISNTHDVVQLWRELCLCHWCRHIKFDNRLVEIWLRKKQVWNLAELSLFLDMPHRCRSIQICISLLIRKVEKNSLDFQRTWKFFEEIRKQAARTYVACRT